MITGIKLQTARAVLAGGGSLASAAIQIGVKASDLDLALWQNLGGRSMPPPVTRAEIEWSRDDYAMIRSLHAGGLTDEQIAAAMMKAVGAVEKRRAGLGLEKNRAGPSAPRRIVD